MQELEDCHTQDIAIHDSHAVEVPVTGHLPQMTVRAFPLAQSPQYQAGGEGLDLLILGFPFQELRKVTCTNQ